VGLTPEREAKIRALLAGVCPSGVHQTIAVDLLAEVDRLRAQLAAETAHVAELESSFALLNRSAGRDANELIDARHLLAAETARADTERGRREIIARLGNANTDAAITRAETAEKAYATLREAATLGVDGKCAFVMECGPMKRGPEAQCRRCRLANLLASSPATLSTAYDARVMRVAQAVRTECEDACAGTVDCDCATLVHQVDITKIVKETK
jgi:hypothetical protein